MVSDSPVACQSLASVIIIVTLHVWIENLTL